MIRILVIVCLLTFCLGCDMQMERETSTGKVIEVMPNDPEMNDAMQRARDTFQNFWSDISADNRRIIPVLTASMVKAYFIETTDPDGGEHLWIDEVTYDGQLISGVVASEPLNLNEPKLGQKVSFPLSRLSDWLIVENGEAKGAFTVQLLRSRMNETDRAEHDALYPFSFPQTKL